MRLLADVRACNVCAAHLPHEPRPVVQAGPTARLLIVGQAPGRHVHETGIPWNDPSGNRLREWLNVSSDVFYDDTRIAIVPTAFCYPGKGRSGDLPPRPECAPLWHPQLLSMLPDVQLTLLIGRYAQQTFLKENCRATLTDTVAAYESYLPEYLPLPHPSPLNRSWWRNNAWFERDMLPVVRERVKAALAL
ncbi:uracil-DNA glycosylase family protein [Noviherbaspirillum cavernae]|uniref:Uracil-DNA glycosylase family protein n=1 Tax=Noviherbaspirillum cavernae TaxID=2320862 RepID=A0A418X4T8_9BURK|nr:uracil-DNA glycosylase family protein [Noviherbaspirillum cavernae]